MGRRAKPNIRAPLLVPHLITTPAASLRKIFNSCIGHSSVVLHDSAPRWWIFVYIQQYNSRTRIVPMLTARPLDIIGKTQTLPHLVGTWNPVLVVIGFVDRNQTTRLLEWLWKVKRNSATIYSWQEHLFTYSVNETLARVIVKSAQLSRPRFIDTALLFHIREETKFYQTFTHPSKTPLPLSLLPFGDQSDVSRIEEVCKHVALAERAFDEIEYLKSITPRPENKYEIVRGTFTELMERYSIKPCF
jgi:hypothetical protein